MKANELMTGDIVRVAKKDVCIQKGTVVSIRGIDADNRFVENHLVGSATCLPINDKYRMTVGVWVEYLEPIPLTPEILEKNFESKRNIFGLRDYILYENFSLEDRKARFCLVRTCNDYIGSKFWVCDIMYVHQLQHALKLFNIEKEIEL